MPERKETGSAEGARKGKDRAATHLMSVDSMAALTHATNLRRVNRRAEQGNCTQCRGSSVRRRAFPAARVYLIRLLAGGKVSRSRRNRESPQRIDRWGSERHGNESAQTGKPAVMHPSVSESSRKQIRFFSVGPFQWAFFSVGLLLSGQQADANSLPLICCDRESIS
jgi:hypothetical protein